MPLAPTHPVRVTVVRTLPQDFGEHLQLRHCLAASRTSTKIEVAGYSGIFHVSVETK